MDIQKRDMFYEICRLCLDEHGFCDIFEIDCLSEQIYKCTGVQVSLNDSLPQRICKICLDIVNKATELRIAAKRNECHLKSLFCDNENGQTKEKESTENNKSAHFEKDNLPQEKNAVIEKFISVRRDLYDSSVSEESIVTHNSSQSSSSQKPVGTKRLKYEDGNTEYKCSICSKIFDKSKKLYLHNRLHNRNYACPIDQCGKKFSTKGDVEKHIRTHTGEKPYDCNLCDKSFAQRGTLKTHKETVHSVG